MKRIITIIIILVVCITTIVLGIFIFNKKSGNNHIELIINEVWENSIDDNVPEFLVEIAKNSSYEIIDISKEDYYIVKTKVKGINVAKALNKSEINKNVTDENEINEILLDIIQESETFEVDANIYVHELKGEYQVQFSDIFVDAMSGCIYSSFLDEVINN